VQSVVGYGFVVNLSWNAARLGIHLFDPETPKIAELLARFQDNFVDVLESPDGRLYGVQEHTVSANDLVVMSKSPMFDILLDIEKENVQFRWLAGRASS
jgi:hypothetical protein